jgi:hypothetical protein
MTIKRLPMTVRNQLSLRNRPIRAIPKTTATVTSTKIVTATSKQTSTKTTAIPATTPISPSA